MDAELTPRRRLEIAIVAAIAATLEQPMQWGRDDCALWCANILRQALRYDPARDFRGRYRTQRGARRVIGAGGLGGVLKRAARRHHWRRVDPAFAQAGDLGLIVGAAGVSSVVICRANGWFVGRDDRGFCAVRSDRVRLAWNVTGEDFPFGSRVNLPALRSRPCMVPSSAAAHEPVSLAIGLTALLSSAGLSAGVAAAVGGFIVSTAIGVGLSLAASLLMPKPDGGGSLDPSLGAGTNTTDVRYTERQALPFKRVIAGFAFVGGALFFEQVKPPYLYLGLLINDGEIAGVDRMWIGANELALSTINFNAIMVPTSVAGQPNYPARVQISVRPGTISQPVDPILAADFTAPAIDANFRQLGIATLVGRFHFGADQTEYTKLWGQVQRPSVFSLVRGVKIYDPRDPTQILSDETTWKWSNNASLWQAYYLTRDWGGRIPTDKIEWQKVAAAADFDDEPIGCKDGTTIARHTIDGVITLNQRPTEVMAALLTANRGAVLQSGGRYWLSSSKPRKPIATIYDAILAGGIEIRQAKPKRDQINKLQVRFVAQEQDYQIIDGPILERADLETVDQETLTGALTLSFTLDHRRAQRLQKAFLATSRLGRTINCRVDISILADLDDELIGNAVTFASDLFPSGNGTYLVASVSFADDGTALDLSLAEYDASIETDWNAALDEQSFTVINPVSP